MTSSDNNGEQAAEPLSAQDLAELARLLKHYGHDPAIRPNRAARALHVRAQVIEHGQATNPCPYTNAHTRAWCGHPFCREG